MLIVNELSDESDGPPAATDTRTRQDALGVDGTVTISAPSFGVDDASVVQVEPASTDNSMFSAPTAPVLDHVTVSEPPAVQVSPPLGEVSVSVAVGAVPGS